MAAKPISAPSSIRDLSLFFVLITCFSPCNSQPEANGMFVFGSSVVDNGNNNYLGIAARADYLPYGVGFPIGPTGRFSDGLTMIDGFSQFLKLPLIPPFLHPNTNGKNILHGVNFASGGSGILDETSPPGVNAISLNKQISNFEEVTLPDLQAQLKLNNQIESLCSALSNYLFVFGAGGNDLRNNYFNPVPDLPAFVDDLIVKLSQQIKRLYSLGARKFVLISVYPLGCIPADKKLLPQPQGCLEDLDQVALLFNSQLKSLVDSLKPQMPGSNLVYVSSYQIIMDALVDPTSEGFNNTENACCEVAPVGDPGAGTACLSGGLICEDRSEYVFFDGLHTSEAMNVVIARKGYSSNLLTEAYPFNVRQLAMLPTHTCFMDT